jgi:transglutaminase-like putative cysteine protease
MRFEVRHRTEYLYQVPVLEAYGEVRLSPPETPTQRVEEHTIRMDPAVAVSSYDDHHGNRTGFFSVPFRHSRLAIENHLVVETSAPVSPAESLSVPVSEVRQILRSLLADTYGYLQFTRSVEPVAEAGRWARRFLGGGRPIGAALEALNEAIYHEFRYQSGSTENTTRLAEVWDKRRGVCQDFAHVMLGILRSANLPARYVCGYIETDRPPDGHRLRGAAATHAWVEVLLPGLVWVALDPTNRQWCGERHVLVSRGRDYREAAPIRGTFKGFGAQRLKVAVTMRRLRPGRETPP